MGYDVLMSSCEMDEEFSQPLVNTLKDSKSAHIINGTRICLKNTLKFTVIIILIWKILLIVECDFYKFRHVFLNKRLKKISVSNNCSNNFYPCV